MRSSTRLGTLARYGLISIAILSPAVCRAAAPASGAISEGSPVVSWTGGPLPPGAASSCGGPNSSACDNFRLTVTPASYPFEVQITLTPQTGDDYDLEVYGPDGALLGHSGNAAGQAELVTLDGPAAGTYTVSAIPFAETRSYSAAAKIVSKQGPPPTSNEVAPIYDGYAAPDGLGTSAGEPSLGIDWKTGKVMYIASTQTLQVGFSDCSSPARASWKDVSFLTTSVTTLDPILFTDNATGRTFVSQLLFPSKQSAMAFTDDDGVNWTPSQGSGITTGADHQTVGGGAFAAGPLGPLTSYPHAVYFCGQDIALAECAVSLDGGLTFGAGVPIYNLSQCGGLHGHLAVAPDGTAYVPNKSCGNQQGVAVSRDNGTTWTVKTVPGSTAGAWDPAVAIDKGGTVYFGFDDGNGHAYVAASNDHGDTWSSPEDVGAPFGIQNTAFPAMVAGDGGRAAFAFLGAAAAGNGAGDDPSWPGVWHLYVAHTYDGGRTWVTTDATPNDPVQRGTICSGGTTNCPLTRNLLDFMGITADAEGRVLVGYADGCVGGCVKGGSNSGTALATIARQRNGKRLFAAFDPVAAPPAAPAAQATIADGIIHLIWSAPDDHGSAVTSYRIYRKLGTGHFSLMRTTSASIHAIDDKGVKPGTAVAYQVTAVNAQGEGPACGQVVPVPAPPSTTADTCVKPGQTVATDPAGDAPAAALDVLSLAVAEPYASDGTDRLVFTLKVASLASLTPGSTWMILWNRPVPDATYDRDYVAMRVTATGSVVYKYGKISPPNLNQGTDLGNADAGSFNANGTIVLTLSAAKADGVKPGQDLGGIEVRTFAANVSGQPVSQATAADYTTPGDYTLRGNAQCPATNGAAAAKNDSATTTQGTPVVIPVLANDTDPDGDALALAAVSPPAHGTAVGEKSGAIVYKPNQGFVGTDGFTYKVTDGHGHTASARVTVAVTSG
jgi:hypothetical protein